VCARGALSASQDRRREQPSYRGCIASFCPRPIAGGRATPEVRDGRACPQRTAIVTSSGSMCACGRGGLSFDLAASILSHVSESGATWGEHHAKRPYRYRYRTAGLRRIDTHDQWKTRTRYHPPCAQYVLATYSVTPTVRARRPRPSGRTLATDGELDVLLCHALFTESRRLRHDHWMEKAWKGGGQCLVGERVRGRSMGSAAGSCAAFVFILVGGLGMQRSHVCNWWGSALVRLSTLPLPLTAASPTARRTEQN